MGHVSKAAVMACLVLCGGCLSDATRLAGYTEPGVHFKRGARGYELTVSSDFEGEAHGEWNKETGQLRLDVKVDSQASDVTTAQGERAAYLERLREIEAEYRAELMRTMLSTWQALAAMAVPAAASPGPADN
jgi:hypothetical protein